MMTKRPRSTGMGSALALAALFAGASASHGQEVSVDVFAGRGDRAILRSSVGGGVRVGLRALPLVGVGLSWTRHAALSGLDGETCDAGGAGCVTESLRNDIELRTIGYEVYLPLNLLGFELSAAAGVDVTSVTRTELRGKETGRTVNAWAPEPGGFKSFTDLNGSHYRLGLAVRPFGLPIAARAAWQHRRMDLGACAADAFAPFCEPINSNELLFGLSIGGFR